MLLLFLIPFVLLWFSFRKWRFADGQRRFVWGTFVACCLAWVVGLLAMMVLPFVLR